MAHPLLAAFHSGSLPLLPSPYVQDRCPNKLLALKSLLQGLLLGTTNQDETLAQFSPCFIHVSLWSESPSETQRSVFQFPFTGEEIAAQTVSYLAQCHHASKGWGWNLSIVCWTSDQCHQPPGQRLSFDIQ